MMEKSEIITPECAKAAAYERLAKDVQVDDDEGGEKKNSALALLDKVLRLKKVCFDNISNHHHGNSNSSSNNNDDKMKKVEQKKEVDDAQEKKGKKRSSWLPDPEKRWPIQGWS